jgi:hypothetical protein
VRLDRRLLDHERRRDPAFERRRELVKPIVEHRTHAEGSTGEEYGERFEQLR